LSKRILRMKTSEDQRKHHEKVGGALSRVGGRGHVIIQPIVGLQGNQQFQDNGNSGKQVADEGTDQWAEYVHGKRGDRTIAVPKEGLLTNTGEPSVLHTRKDS